MSLFGGSDSGVSRVARQLYVPIVVEIAPPSLSDTMSLQKRAEIGVVAVDERQRGGLFPRLPVKTLVNVNIPHATSLQLPPQLPIVPKIAAFRIFQTSWSAGRIAIAKDVDGHVEKLVPLPQRNPIDFP